MKFIDLSFLTDLKKYKVNKLDYTCNPTIYKNKDEFVNNESSFYRSLNGSYKFMLLKSPNEIKEEFLKESFDISNLDNIEVPSCIELKNNNPKYVNQMYPWDGSFISKPPFINLNENPTALYFKEFDIEDLNENINISFEAGAVAMYVYLNGQFVGYSEDSFLPARFNLNKYLKHHNRLVVILCSFSKASYIEDQDYWRLTGLYRDVFLFKTPKCHVDDFKITSSLINNYKNGQFKIDVRTKNVSNIKGKLSYAGKVIREFKFENHYESVIENINSWSGENPCLYDLELEVYNKKNLSEYIHQYVGFRTIELKNKVMYLNGQRIIFRGINRHEFSCYGGRHVTREEMMEDILFLKKNNINAVRTSHYPNDSYWYELCDKYGIYLIDEVNMESHGSWTKMDVFDPSWNVPGSLDEWEDLVIDRVNETYERDKNHPSILIWSIGNESWAGTNTVKMHDRFKELDSSRLVHYESCMHVPEYRNSTDIESYMYAKVSEIEHYLNNKPDKPFILCEYSHAMGNSLGNLDEYIALEDKYDLYQGGFIWDYMDQGIVTKDGKWLYGGDFYDRPHDNSFCCNGVRYCNRTDSPKVSALKYAYSPLKITVNDDSVNIVNKNLFTSTDIYYFVVTILKCGELIKEFNFNINIEPLSNKTIKIDLCDIKDKLEYTICVSARLKEDTGLLKENHEVAFGEKIFGKYSHEVELNNNNYKIINSDLNIGVHNENIDILFSKREGGIISLKYNGQEWVNKPMLPTFFRANTDNDKGNRFNIDSSIWYSVDQFISYTNKQYSFNIVAGIFSINYTYVLQNEKKNTVDVLYTVYGDGNVKVNVKYHGAKGLPELSLFGVQLAIPNKVESYKYYGLGPVENYPDRQEGVRMGIFNDTPSNNVSKYIEPQECGNRCEIRNAQLNLENGHSLEIYMNDLPLNISVLPYSNIELELAKHIYELNKDPQYTWLRVCGFMRGIGGDDSWGAPVHPQYTISGENDLEFSFFIQGK